MSEHTRRMHTDFKRVLIGLALCPLVAVIPVAYNIASVSMRLNNGVLTAYSTTWGSSIALLNPLVTILVVQTYRSAAAEVIVNVVSCVLRSKRNVVAHNSNGTL